MSDALARPYDPFQITPRYVWVECPLPEYAGFAVKVRANLRNRDRKDLIDLIADVDAEAKRIAEKAQKRIEALMKKGGFSPAVADLIDENARVQDANRARVPAAICAHVVAWNLEETDTETGATADLPPPSVIGVEAFANLEQPMVDWIVGTIVMAYRSGKSINSSPTRGESDGQASASSETSPPENNASDQPSPETSPTPSASPSES